MTARWLALALAIALPAADGARAQNQVLRVCADPANLPFSNRAGQGLENRLVDLVAKDLKVTIRYVWWTPSRGDVDKTLKSHDCDLWPGVASGLDALATTAPYYRSTYVFVSRARDRLGIRSFDDPRLRTLRVGVQLIGDDGWNTPPAHVLADKGVIANVRGFTLLGRYGQANAAANIVRAVADGEVDVALVWGPVAGYFAALSSTPLDITPTPAWPDGRDWPMAFDISMGVRRDEPDLERRLDAFLAAERPRIEALVRSYHVPAAMPAALAWR